MKTGNPLAPRLLAVLGLGLALGVVARGASSCGPPPLRVGTYNIREFGKAKTDLGRLVAILEDANADVLALQEIQDPRAAKALARRLGGAGRRWTVVLSACGGARSPMHVGFLFDAARVRLEKTKEYPELDPDPDRDGCGSDRPGFAATFRGDDRTFQLLAVHMAAGSDPDRFERRKVQWANAHAIAAALAKDGPVAILGDTNSTGYLDDARGERTFILEQAKRAGLEVVTREVGCTEYFGPAGGALSPSVLDHFVATPGLAASRSVRAHSFCATLACKPADRAPPDFTAVSDHCPVTLDLAR